MNCTFLLYDWFIAEPKLHFVIACSNSGILLTTYSVNEMIGNMKANERHCRYRRLSQSLLSK